MVLLNSQFIDLYLMTEQFNFEQFTPLNWLKSASQYTDKHLLTYSEISKENFLEEYFAQQTENVQNKPKNKGDNKQKNKVNAKNYRDRKKTNYQYMRKQIQYLQHENNILKNQKYCRWCRKNYQENVIVPTETIQGKSKECIQHISHQKDPQEMELQFQKPETMIKKKNDLSGKIWIALGILMLVLGITLHGFNGNDKYVRTIELQRSQIGKWVNQYQDKSKDEYFNVKMRFKQQTRISKTQQNQIRIRYISPMETPENSSTEEEVSINKELLFGIHAQLEDIGNYL